MNNENPVQGASQPADASAEALHVPVPLEGNFPMGVLMGAAAAIVGAVIWAGVTVATEYQIGWMAVGLGFLVGIAVRKFGHGTTNTYAIAGAALALGGCVLGNFFTIIGFVSAQEQMNVFQTLGSIDYGMVPKIMAETASPMDFLFYGIAVYEGFKFSIDRG